MESVNSRTIGKRRFIPILLPVLIAAAAAVPAGAQTPSYSYFPTASTTDSRMLAIGGVGAESLGGVQMDITLGVPANASMFEFGIFDGDTGKTPTGAIDPGAGHWDGGSTQLMYSLYADPMANGSGTTLLASWKGNDPNPTSGPGWVASSPTMPDNDWWNVVVQNSPLAQSKSGNYFYDLRCQLQDPMTNAVSAFKVRSTGSIVLNPMTIGFEAALANMQDMHTVYPAFTGNTLPGPGSQFWLTTPTTYDGKWTFFMDVPPSPKNVTLWDGDFDYGTDPSQLFGNPSGVPLQQTADTDDPDTGHIVPSFSTTPHVPPQGAQGAGNPPDDNPSDFIRRSPSVIYNLTDPTGNVYWNSNPSGNMEWEQFLITSDPAATRAQADYGPNVAADGKTFVKTSTLPGGIWKINILGLDLGNTSYFYPFAPLVGVNSGGNPVPPPPVNPPLTCTVAESLLWPPNHDMVNIGLAVTPGATGEQIGVKVYSNEPDVPSGTGDDHFSPDAKMGSQPLGANFSFTSTSTSTVQLPLNVRRERLGDQADGSGRCYLVVVTGTNPDGSTGSCVEASCIPHDQSARSKNAVMQLAMQAEAYYQKNGTPPPSWSQVGIGPTVGPKQ